MDVRTGQVHGVEGVGKTSALFRALLDQLRPTDAQAPVIHVILDNYRMHDSKLVQAAPRRVGWSHPAALPAPLRPPDNKIERVWQDVHANVTRNHTCPRMTALRREGRYYLRQRNRRMLTNRGGPSLTEAAA